MAAAFPFATTDPAGGHDMTHRANASRRRILLVGHGLLTPLGPVAASTGLVVAPDEHSVGLFQLPRPAFTLRTAARPGRPQPALVAERLDELDQLEALFEELAALVAGGAEVIGLAVPARQLASRPGEAWLARVRVIARDIAGLTLDVWTVRGGQAAKYDPTAQPVRTAS